MNSKFDKATKVLSLISYRADAINRMLDSIENVYGPDEALDEAKFEEKKKVLEIVQNICDETVDKVMAVVAQVYAECYTESELEQLIAWYESPLGIKVLTEADKNHELIQNAFAQWGDQLWNRVRLRMGWTK